MAAKKVSEVTPAPGVKILLAVLGTTPAVLTEALYELIVGATNRSEEPFVPDEIHVITTTTGLAVLRENLFANGQRPGKLAEIVKEYADIFDNLQISGFQMEAKPTRQSRAPEPRDKVKAIPLFVTVTKNDDRTELADIRGAKDIEAAETTTWNHVSELTAHDNVEIRALVAGGRKTLSNVLHNIMTFLGRPQDKLYHVLVSEPFDSPFLDPPFFFPPKTPADHTLIKFIQVNGKPVEILAAEAKKLELSVPSNAKALLWIEKSAQSSHCARTELAEIRFPRLRGGIPASLLKADKKQKSFAEGYRNCLNIADELAVSQHDLTIDLRDQTIQVGKNCVITGLTPVDLSFFLFIAIERANCQLKRNSDGAVDFYFDLQYFASEDNLKKYFGHYLGLTMLTTQKPSPYALGSNEADGHVELHYCKIKECGSDPLKPEELLNKALSKDPWPGLISTTKKAIQTFRDELRDKPSRKVDIFDDLKNIVTGCLCTTNKADPLRAYVQAMVLAPATRAVKTFFDDRLTTCKNAVIHQLGPALANQVTFIRIYQDGKTSYHLPIEASRIFIRDTKGSLVSACPASIE